MLGAVITWLRLGAQAVAQSDVALATRQVNLQELSEVLFKRDRVNRQSVRDYACRAGIYTLADVPTGSRTVTVTVTVTVAGYHPVSPTTTVLDGVTSVLDIQLSATPVGGVGTLKDTVINSNGVKARWCQRAGGRWSVCNHQQGWKIYYSKCSGRRQNRDGSLCRRGVFRFIDDYCRNERYA